jgi:hypothetical protein
MALYIGLALVAFFNVFVFLLPETLQTPHGTENVHGHTDTQLSLLHRLFEQVRDGARRFKYFTQRLFSEEKQVGILFLRFVLTAYGRESQRLCMYGSNSLHMATRFRWSPRQVDRYSFLRLCRIFS